MFWNKKAPETPLNSQEYEKVCNMVTTLNAEIKLLKGDLTGVMFDLEKLKAKLNKRNTQTPENPPSEGVFSGLPPAPTKGLNSLNPFL
jgi:hypothetical protein